MIGGRRAGNGVGFESEVVGGGNGSAEKESCPGVQSAVVVLDCC